MYTYHKYRKSIDSQVPLDLDGNPVSDEGGGVALDLGYIHENGRYSAEEARPLAPSSPFSSDGQRAHNAVRALFPIPCHYIKLNSCQCRPPTIRQVTTRCCLLSMRKTVVIRKSGKDGQINYVGFRVVCTTHAEIFFPPSWWNSHEEMVRIFMDHFRRTDERYRLAKFDAACAPSSSVLMEFDGKCQSLLFCSGHESRSELDSRSHAFVGLALSSKWFTGTRFPARSPAKR